jgi:uncharacterized YccA/Bax inhibitor family protein
MNKIMKPLVAAAIPLLTASGSWIITGQQPDSAEVWLGATGVFMALAVVVATVFLPDEEDAAVMKWYETWGKFIAAAVTPVLSAFIQYFVAPGSTTRDALATAAVGFLTALLMAYVQNAPDS